MDKGKKKVIIWIASVVLIALIVLGMVLIIRNYFIQKYTYVPGETQFIFKLKHSWSQFDEIYELNTEGQLIISDNNPDGIMKVWDLNEGEIAFIADYIVLDHKFHRWTKRNEINEKNYSSIRTNYEESLTTIAVTFNGEIKSLGSYYNGNLSPGENRKTDNKIVNEIYSYLKEVKKKEYTEPLP